MTGYPYGFHPMPVDPTLDRFAEALRAEFDEMGFIGLLRNSLVVRRIGGARLGRVRRDDGLRVRAAAVPRATRAA